MSRYTGKGVLTGTYNVKYYGPLDTRLLVFTYEDLLLESNWVISGYGSIAYNGMIVAVGSDTNKNLNGVYYLFDEQRPGRKDEPDVTNEINWHKLAGLDELSLIETRVKTLEEQFFGSEFVDSEDLSIAIDTLKDEIIRSGYLTETDLLEAGYITQEKAEELFYGKKELDEKFSDVYSKIDNIKDVQAGITYVDDINSGDHMRKEDMLYVEKSSKTPYLFNSKTQTYETVGITVKDTVILFGGNS